MRTMRRGLSIGVLLCLMPWGFGAVADCVWGEVQLLRQPDGEVVEVRIWGDEFYQIVESLDGYTLVRDPKTTVVCYAVLSDDKQELLSTGVRYEGDAQGDLGIPRHVRADSDAAQVRARTARLRRASQLAAAPGGAPTHGEVEGLCLIVDFDDEVGTITPVEVEAYCNQVGYSANGNNGSVRDFYYDVSNGAITYTNYVPASYYRANELKTYYDDPTEDNGPKAVEMITEALDDLDAGGFDFSQYDVDGDGLVDAVNCFYAGYRASGWSMGLWPHAGVMFYQADGVTILRYQVTDMRDYLRIGTFCHENGHMLLNWPDLYDYDYDSRGIGRYCLMAGGGSGANPNEPCVYLKDLAGWTTTITLSGLRQTGLAATAGSNVTYKWPNPADDYEYYMIYNRQQTGRDDGLPDGGLAIWHIDRAGSNNYNEMLPDHHFKVTLVQADGEWDLEHDVNSGDTTDLWKAPSFTDCGPNTTPPTSWWNTQPSYLQVLKVSASGATMTFEFQGLGGRDEDFDGDGVSDYDETRDFDAATPGVQNPLDPFETDATGDDGQDTPDGIPDGENDFDGDGTSNADESRWGGDLADPSIFLPAATLPGLAALAAMLAAAFLVRSARGGARSARLS